mgnify:FL=1
MKTIESEEIMLQVGSALVSLDVIERFFVCDLEKCLGACCIEGDAGAPVSEEECRKLKEILPVIWDDLLPEAKSVIERQGVAYVDEEGDLVTSIVNGKDCVFTCYGKNGMCQCAVEKAFREGKIDFYKPVSCAFERIQSLCGGKLSPLENLQGSRSIGTPGKSEGLRIFERTVDSQVWRKVV